MSDEPQNMVGRLTEYIDELEEIRRQTRAIKGDPD
jgi:hypothetical protein